MNEHYKYLALVIVLIIVCMLCITAYRVFQVHSGSGTFALIRKQGSQHWLHSRLAYSDKGIKFITHNPFHLTGYFPRSSISINNRIITYTPLEQNMDTICSVTVLSSEMELALSADAATAFQSWIESSPSQRQVPRPKIN